MTLKRILSPVSVLVVLMFLFMVSSPLALADHHEEASEHGLETAHDKISVSIDTGKEQQMRALLVVLQQLVDLLSKQLERQHADTTHDESDDHDADHADEHAADELQISVEEHGGRTHVHVHTAGHDEQTFFLEELALDQRDEIIAAIALETGLSEDEVAAAATFADVHEEEEDDHDEHMDDEADEDDPYAGIHIMGDGTIMLGNGEVVADATITADGMIELADGTLLEPTADLRE